jgi:hypothetical protein
LPPGCTPESWRSATSNNGQHRVERDDLGHVRAGHHDLQRLADLDGHVDHDAGDRRHDLTLLLLGLGLGECGLRGPEIRLDLRLVDGREGAELDQAKARLRLAPFLLHLGPCLEDLGDAGLVGQDRQDVAGLHDRAAPDPEVEHHAGGAGDRPDLPVGLCAARERDAALMHLRLRRQHRDLEQGRGNGRLRLERCFLRRVAAEHARPDPCGTTQNEREGRDAGRLHGMTSRVLAGCMGGMAPDTRQPMMCMIGGTSRAGS